MRKEAWVGVKREKTVRDPRGNPSRVIPEGVLRQFDAQVSRMRPEPYLPIALLLRCTGWRLQEILGLRLDGCLEQDQYGWWLHSSDAGGTLETQGRRVPIPKQAARALEAQIQRASTGAVGAANLERFVFVNCEKRGQGRRIVKDQVRVALLRLAYDCGIVGEDGEVYYLTASAFRGTKYMEMIYAGIDLGTIQWWMNDSSLDVGLHYVLLQSESSRLDV